MKFLLAGFWDEPQGITRHRFNISALLSSVWTTLLCNVGRITVEATSSGACGRGGLIPQRQTGWFRVWRNPGWYKGWGGGSERWSIHHGCGPLAHLPSFIIFFCLEKNLSLETQDPSTSEGKQQVSCVDPTERKGKSRGCGDEGAEKVKQEWSERRQKVNFPLPQPSAHDQPVPKPDCTTKGEGTANSTRSWNDLDSN